MPIPEQGESERDYISRCIPAVLHEGTAKDGKQAAAICYSVWDKYHEGKDKKEMSRGPLIFRMDRGGGGFFFRNRYGKVVHAQPGQGKGKEDQPNPLAAGPAVLGLAGPRKRTGIVRGVAEEAQSARGLGRLTLDTDEAGNLDPHLVEAYRRHLAATGHVLGEFKVNPVTKLATAAVTHGGMGAGGTPAAKFPSKAFVQPAAQPAAGGDVQRYQFRANKEGGQTFGTQQEVRPLTAELYDQHVKGSVGGQSFADYQRQHPDVTHVSLTRQPGQDWRLSGVGKPGELGPSKVARENGWIKPVTSHDSPEAKAFGSVADSSLPGAKAASARAYGTETWDQRVARMNAEADQRVEQRRQQQEPTGGARGAKGSESGGIFRRLPDGRTIFIPGHKVRGAKPAVPQPFHPLDKPSPPPESPLVEAAKAAKTERAAKLEKMADAAIAHVKAHPAADPSGVAAAVAAQAAARGEDVAHVGTPEPAKPEPSLKEFKAQVKADAKAREAAKAAEQTGTKEEPKREGLQSIRQQIHDYYRESGGGLPPHIQQDLENMRAAFVVYNKSPRASEFRQMAKEGGVINAKGGIQFTDNPREAGAEDAITELTDKYGHHGEEYYRQAFRERSGTGFHDALEHTRQAAGAGDQRAQWLVRLHDQYTPGKKDVIPSEKLGLDDHAKLHGEPIQVTLNEDGEKVVSDGGTFPTVPLSDLKGVKLPIDKGSLHHVEPDLPAAKPAAAKVAAPEQPNYEFVNKFTGKMTDAGLQNRREHADFLMKHPLPNVIPGMKVTEAQVRREQAAHRASKAASYQRSREVNAGTATGRTVQQRQRRTAEILRTNPKLSYRQAWERSLTMSRGGGQGYFFTNKHGQRVFAAGHTQGGLFGEAPAVPVEAVKPPEPKPVAARAQITNTMRPTVKAGAVTSDRASRVRQGIAAVHEHTLAEYRERQAAPTGYDKAPAAVKAAIDAGHAKAVRDAVAGGETVHPEVLEDYQKPVDNARQLGLMKDAGGAHFEVGERAGQAQLFAPGKPLPAAPAEAKVKPQFDPKHTAEMFPARPKGLLDEMPPPTAHPVDTTPVASKVARAQPRPKASISGQPLGGSLERVRDLRQQGLTFQEAKAHQANEAKEGRPLPIHPDIQHRIARANESDQERSWREYRENAGRVSDNPHAASVKDLERAQGYLNAMRDHTIRQAKREGKEVHPEIIQGYNNEIESYERIAKQKRGRTHMSRFARAPDGRLRFAAA